MSGQNPAPGWYAAPHANNEQRYWDGAQWLEPQPTSPTAVLLDASAPLGGTPAKQTPVLAIVALIAGIIAFFTGIVPILGVILGLGAIALGVLALVKQQRKALAVTGVVLGVVAVITSIAVTAGISASLSASDRRPVAVQTGTPVEEPEEEEEPPNVTVAVPDVAGMTAADAYNAISAAGLTPPEITSFKDPLAKVVSTSPAAGSEAEEGSDITFMLEEKPELTVGQQNAVGSAKSYLNLTGFSRSGLIEQLVFEGFSSEDATFGADNAGADWNQEAAESAQSYLDISSFSRQGLYDQLAFEGFQAAEIEFGLAAVGY